MMKFKRILTLLIAVLISFTSFGQSSEIQKIDKKLTTTYKKMVTANFKVKPDRHPKNYPALFEKDLRTSLGNPLTFDYSLDSLSKYLTIKTSTDRKIKFYSYDQQDGGSWHTINAFAQFKMSDGAMNVTKINSTDDGVTGEFTESSIDEIFQILINDKTHYLTFAWGTHGSGHQHRIAQIFSISGDQLVKCKSCFENNGDLVIEYPRDSKANLKFDPKTNTISHAEFKMDQDMGFYKPTGKTLTLKLVNGIFKQQ